MKSLFKLIYYWGPVLGLMAVIFYFSSLHAIAVTPTYWSEFAFKKTLHLLEYATLWTLLFRAFTNTTSSSRQQAAIWSLIITILYGISDEVHQSFVPTREPSLRDVVIDSLGASLAFYLIYKQFSKLPQFIQKILTILEIK